MARVTGEHVIIGVGELRERFLDWLYTQSGGKTSESVDVGPFITEVGIDPGTAYDLVRDGADRGLMRDDSTFDSPCAALTLDGVQAAEERYRRRAEPTKRAAAGRAGLLRWLYDQQLAGVYMPVVADVLDTTLAVFVGERLTAFEIDRAAKYLTDKGLIKGVTVAEYDGPVRASLTSDGLDCIENYGGDVAGSLDDRAGRAGTQTYNIGTFNNTGAVALGGGDAHQQVTDDAAMVVAFTQALLRQLGALPMDKDHRLAIQTAVEELRHELDQPDPEGGRISRALSRVVGYITDAGKPALTALLLALAQQHGLPPN